MNWITIIGVMLIALGTGLTYYGTSISNKEDIKKGMDSFSQQIEELKKEQTSESTREKVKDLETEFDKWAKNFVADKKGKALELEKLDLKAKEMTVNLNSKYRIIYVFFFESLKNYVEAYNRNSQAKIIYSIQNFPDNIFLEAAENYMPKIQFQDKVVWKFRLAIIEPIDKERLPAIVLIVDDNYDDSSGSPPELFVAFSPDKNEIFLESQFRRIKVPGLQQSYDLAKYEDSIHKILKRLIEFQLLRLKK